MRSRIKAKTIGLLNALLTCAKSNIASARVIQKNGGVLDSEEVIDGELWQRYWIETIE